MDYTQNTFISSTFWTERIGPTAALATIEFMKKNSTLKIKKLAKKYKKWKDISDENELN